MNREQYFKEKAMKYEMPKTTNVWEYAVSNGFAKGINELKQEC